MIRYSLSSIVCVLLAGIFSHSCFAQSPTVDEAKKAMQQAVGFFRTHASAHGGYVFQIAADLKRREGEGKVGTTTAWIEPPATPSVGMAYLEAYRITGDAVLLEAAKETAQALIRGQLESGGWDTKIEFAAADRKRYAYRVDHSKADKRFNHTTFDDDKTQAAIRFMMQLDQELEFKVAAVHDCASTSLDCVLKAQYRSGAWPQRFDGHLPADQKGPKQASFPDSWPREYVKLRYSEFYTLNDNTVADLISTLLDAWEVYGDERYLESAIRGGDFLRFAQLPQPQPGWAQQYDANMQPVWARKFEPPAVSGAESQGVMNVLLTLYERTASVEENARRFLEPIAPAVAYFRSSLRTDGKLARFYEMKTNRPLYFTQDYRLTYDDTDMPTHYAFVVGSKIDRIERRYQMLRELSPGQIKRQAKGQDINKSAKLAGEARRAIDSLDERGAWVEPGRLRYHDEEAETNVIRSETFCKNLVTLARWIAAND